MFKYPLFEYYRLQALRQKLNLPGDYDFVQSEEDEPITAIQKGTGHMMVWNVSRWTTCKPDESE